MTIVASSIESVGANDPAFQPAAWQREMRDAIRDPGQLCRLLDLPQRLVGPAHRAAQGFKLFVPKPYFDRIRPGDPSDPLLRQVLPAAEELAETAGFDDDPVGDQTAQLSSGLLQKYPGRVLMITTGACAVHCRYCFRRHFAYQEAPNEVAAWQGALDQIRSDTSIHEVLLSGGDPLTRVDRHLAELTNQLAAIDHVRRLRIHTRLPIMIPQRVNDELLDWLRATRLTPIMVVHVNHPAEIDRSVESALARLVDAGIPLLNQAVLLRGINDNVETLHQLCERLVDLRVMPYYLHQLDRVRGAAHFEVPIATGIQLIEQLRARLPGYAVPRFVQEQPGKSHKTPLA